MGDGRFTRPAQVPDRSDTVLVTTIGYNTRGEAYQTTDPAGKIAQKAFDGARFGCAD